MEDNPKNIEWAGEDTLPNHIPAYRPKILLTSKISKSTLTKKKY